MIWEEHVKNRSAFPPDELARFEGQHVAWSADGRRILAADEDPLKLVAGLEAAGHRPEDYVLSFVDGDSQIGGAAFNESVWEKTE